MLYFSVSPLTQYSQSNIATSAVIILILSHIHELTIFHISIEF